VAKVVAVSISKEKGVRKQEVSTGTLLVNWGLEGDAHAGKWHRQVSLLGIESIEKMRAALKTRDISLMPGDFAENITTQGLELYALPVGTYLSIGETLLEVTQIGKKCHQDCEIAKTVGTCVMPTEGIFARVLVGGRIGPEDEVRIWQGTPAGILTASDKGYKGEREDASAREIERLAGTIGCRVIDYRILPDEENELAQAMVDMIDNLGVKLLFTTGGTGFSPRDVTPEATLKVIERQVPGLPEAMRRETANFSSRAMLSRAVAGIRGKGLIINLPGSPKGVCEWLQVILPVLPHAVEILQGNAGECGNGVHG
jgi:molybdenum cofactor synthesis domain-containing protein